MQNTQKITLAHGSGGRLSANLINSIASAFGPQNTQTQYEDCAFIDQNTAVTTDGFTITPRKFPGGDIGKLAICGATNDLAVRGVKPQWITMGLIIEEGLPQNELLEYIKSASDVCSQLGINLIAGDTKVVPTKTADGLYITITAIGKKQTTQTLGMQNIKPGDSLIITTSIARHGSLIGALRYGIDPGSLQSDCAPLWQTLSPLLPIQGLHAMRDCTRGGLGTVLCEWAEGTNLGIEITQQSLPLDPAVTAISDILGFDPLYLACEGCALIACDPKDEGACLGLLHQTEHGQNAQTIGRVTSEHPGIAAMLTPIGGTRIIDMPIGELLPRIC